MGQETANDPIDVLVAFSQKEGLKPLAFRWQGRRINIQKVNLRYESSNGKEPVIHFAVSNDSAAYQLDYYSQQQRWKLGGYYVE